MAGPTSMLPMAGQFFRLNTLEFKVTNWVSCICAVLTFSYILYLSKPPPGPKLISGWKKPIFVSRVSLKLQTAIAFFDIIRHLINIFNYDSHEITCAFLGFMFYFCYHINTFLNVAIALNLHITYLKERMPHPHFRPLLYSVPFIAALAIDVIPFCKNLSDIHLTT